MACQGTIRDWQKPWQKSFSGNVNLVRLRGRWTLHLRSLQVKNQVTDLIKVDHWEDVKAPEGACRAKIDSPRNRAWLIWPERGTGIWDKWWEGQNSSQNWRQHGWMQGLLLGSGKDSRYGAGACPLGTYSEVEISSLFAFHESNGLSCACGVFILVFQI